MRLGAVVLLALILLAAAGCASRSSTAASPAAMSLRIGLVTDSVGRGDQSFNDSAIAGLDRARQDFGVDEQVLESHSPSDYAANLTRLADSGCDLVVGVGVTMATAVKAAARRHPRGRFAIVDGDVRARNVRVLRFREEQGCYLVGALAACMTHSRKIGFVGGMRIPLIEKFLAGYEAGVRKVRPGVRVLIGYTGVWDDPGRGRDVADAQFQRGADIVFHAAGACGLGVIDAAREKGAGFFAIGVDSDQDHLAPGHVLTSMVKRVDRAVYDTIRDLREGRFTAGEKVYGLKEDGVGLSPMKYTRDRVPPEILLRVEALRRAIVAGRIVVPVALARHPTPTAGP